MVLNNDHFIGWAAGSFEITLNEQHSVEAHEKRRLYAFFSRLNSSVLILCSHPIENRLNNCSTLAGTMYKNKHCWRYFSFLSHYRSLFLIHSQISWEMLEFYHQKWHNFWANLNVLMEQIANYWTIFQALFTI